MRTQLASAPVIVVRPDVAIIRDAVFLSNRVATNLERLVAVANCKLFDIEPAALDAALRMAACALCDWTENFSRPMVSERVRDNSAALRDEADMIAAAIFVGHPLGQIATKARTWAQAVRGWAELVSMRAPR